MFDLFLDILLNNLPYIIVVIALMLIDTITGLTKAFRFKMYESSKARKIFSKMIVYLGLIFAFMFIEFLLINLELKLGYEEFKTGNITIILCVAMSIVELSSINENFEVITGKNYISEIVDFVINKLKNFIDKFIRKDDNND
jgi:hypothetical protein